MSPCVAVNNMVNGGFAYTIFQGQDGRSDTAASILRANPANCLGRQLGIAVLLSTGHQFGMLVRPMVVSERAAWSHITALANLVVTVIGVCSKKKVSRILARRVVAMMENAQTGRDGTVCKGPRNAICGGNVPTATLAKAKLSIRQASLAALGEFTCRPRPALVGSTDTDLLPESQNVLRSQRWDSTIRLTHDGLLTGRYARTACGQPAGRSYRNDPTTRPSACQHYPGPPSGMSLMGVGN